MKKNIQEIGDDSWSKSLEGLGLEMSKESVQEKFCPLPAI